jgi:hypothetical protein
MPHGLGGAVQLEGHAQFEEALALGDEKEKRTSLMSSLRPVKERVVARDFGWTERKRHGDRSFDPSLGFEVENRVNRRLEVLLRLGGAAERTRVNVEGEFKSPLGTAVSNADVVAFLVVGFGCQALKILEPGREADAQGRVEKCG